MELPNFSDIEETISFYTRNDFAIVNSLLAGNMNDLWESALIAYNDNKGIIKEYEDGVRTINGEYDEKWIKILRSRLIDKLDYEAKERILKNARNDISNILNAMKPTKDRIILYRTAWIQKNEDADNTYPYAHQYKALCCNVNDILEIKIISSTSLTPYREEDDIDCDFYRYEITVPRNGLVLELNQFECHNEEGEVLLPTMKCKVKNIRNSDNKKCRGIIELEYIKKLSVNLLTQDK